MRVKAKNNESKKIDELKVKKVGVKVGVGGGENFWYPLSAHCERPSPTLQVAKTFLGPPSHVPIPPLASFSGRGASIRP